MRLRIVFTPNERPDKPILMELGPYKFRFDQLGLKQLQAAIDGVKVDLDYHAVYEDPLGEFRIPCINPRCAEWVRVATVCPKCGIRN